MAKGKKPGESDGCYQHDRADGHESFGFFLPVDSLLLGLRLLELRLLQAAKVALLEVLGGFACPFLLLVVSDVLPGIPHPLPNARSVCYFGMKADASCMLALCIRALRAISVFTRMACEWFDHASSVQL
jgi:hypothetical protein